MMDYKQIGTILAAIMITAGGTIYLQETSSYKNCNGGWELTNSGKYYCESRNLYEWCYKGSVDGTNIGYRCYIGIPIIEPVIVEDKVSNDYTVSTDGKNCYLKGYLKMKGELIEGICKV